MILHTTPSTNIAFTKAEHCWFSYRLWDWAVYYAKRSMTPKGTKYSLHCPDYKTSNKAFWR